MVKEYFNKSGVLSKNGQIFWQLAKCELCFKIKRLLISRFYGINLRLHEHKSSKLTSSMKLLQTPLIFAIFLSCANFLSAQSASIQPSSQISNLETDLTVVSSGDENWTFYLDKESQVYYIDLETIKVNVSDIVVKNESGEVVFKDNLWDLPVNTIYELDVKNFEEGRYSLELRTYTSVIRKEINVAP